MTDDALTLDALLTRFGGEEYGQEVVARISLRAALQGGDDPLKIIFYMRELGLSVSTLDDLLAINGDGFEEELAAFEVAEGVAVSVASQGEWVLFTP
jgi:hypothetical protein